MFGFGKKKTKTKNEDEEVEEVDLSRRNFLKGAAVAMPAGVAGVVVMASGDSSGAESRGTSNTPKSNYLKKTWKEDGITYMEYELPSNVQPFFKHSEGRQRAISVPIYNMDKEAFNHENSTRRDTIIWDHDLDLVEKKARFVKTLIGYIDMGKSQDPKGWADPYIYIINIKGNDNLFGAMINQKKLEFETNVYTVYG